MGVPTGLLQASNPGKLRAVGGARKLIGPSKKPAMPITGKHRLGGGAHMAKRDSLSAFGVDHGRSG